MQRFKSRSRRSVKVKACRFFCALRGAPIRPAVHLISDALQPNRDSACRPSRQHCMKCGANISQTDTHGRRRLTRSCRMPKETKAVIKPRRKRTTPLSRIPDETETLAAWQRLRPLFLNRMQDRPCHVLCPSSRVHGHQSTGVSRNA